MKKLTIVFCFLLLISFCCGCSLADPRESLSSDENLSASSENSNSVQSIETPIDSTIDSEIIEVNYEEEINAFLSGLTLEGNPQATQASLDKFKAFVLEQPSEQGYQVITDDELVYSMLMPAYWGLDEEIPTESSSSSIESEVVESVPTTTIDDWTLPEDYAYLDDDLAAYSDIADELFDYINELRSEYGLDPLKRSYILDYTAQVRANHLDQVTDDEYANHAWPGDANFTWNRVFDNLGLSSYWKFRGENLARISFNGNAEDWRIVVFGQSGKNNGWKNSSGHLKNILGDDDEDTSVITDKYTDIGIGIANVDGRYYIVTHFATWKQG